MRPPGRARSICSMAFTTPRWITCRWSRLSANRREPRLGASYQQEVDLQNLFKDVAVSSSRMASVPEQVRHLIDRAVRIAHNKRTVTCVILPNDLQELDLRRPAGGAWRNTYRRRLCGPGEIAR